MNISENTIEILKNFSQINSGIYFEGGKKIQTVAPSKAILAKATIDEEIPVPFGLYDLNRFLGAMTLFNDLQISFEEKYALLMDEASSTSCNYNYCDASLVVRPPENKQVALPSEDVIFSLSKKVFDGIVKASSVLQFPEICIRNNKNVVELVTTDTKNPGDEFVVKVGETDKTFNIIFKVENISKLKSTDYTGFLSAKGLARFDSTDGVLQYYVALEPNSSFEG